MKFLVAFICVAFLASVSQAKVRYDNYLVYRVTFSSEEEFNYLYQMDMQSTDLMFWQLSHSQHYADIMIAPEKMEAFLKNLTAHGLHFELMIEDVQKLIDSERM